MFDNYALFFYNQIAVLMNIISNFLHLQQRRDVISYYEYSVSADILLNILHELNFIKIYTQANDRLISQYTHHIVRLNWLFLLRVQMFININLMHDTCSGINGPLYIFNDYKKHQFASPAGGCIIYIPYLPGGTRLFDRSCTNNFIQVDLQYNLL